MEASAIVLAAGEGTRMKSDKPKVVHKVLDKPLIRWVVDAAQDAGISHIVSVLGHKSEQVLPLVQDDTTVVYQEQRLGTADAVAVCESSMQGKQGSLVVLTGDSPLITAETITSLIETRETLDAAVVVLTMEMQDPFGYGRIVRNTTGGIERIVEEKDCFEEQARITECNSGFYCFDIQTLFDGLKRIKNDNAQGEYYLTDIIEICNEEGKLVAAVKAEDSTECLGVNSRSQLAEATKLMQIRINERHMTSGVTMVDPSLVWIGPDVCIEPDTEILPMTFLYGSTSLGTGSIVGPNSRLTDTIVGKNCVIDETIAVEAKIEDDVTCGPRAYLRPETLLCCGSKAGTHVEIKKSIVGKGSKVPHLSYIGDATIGEDVNIGAGSITCNYDGSSKHKTVVKDGAFIGSDTMLVAPVTIGEGATVGAGSAITKDVSAGALGIERSQQREISDWEARKSKKS